MTAFLLTGCAAFEGITNPMRSPDNPNCMDMSSFKIAQVLDDGALAYECQGGTCSAFNRWVKLDIQPNIDYYDDQIVNVPSDKCAIQKDVFQYETKDNRIKTVPVIDFDYMYKSNSDEENERRFQEWLNISKFRMYNACIKDLKTSDKEKCACFADAFVDNLIKVELTTYKKERSGIIKKIEKTCGTIPKKIKDQI